MRHDANGALYALNYDVQKDFEPVSLLASFPLVIAANKSIPAKDLKEFVAWQKAKATPTLQGSAGVGSSGHLTGIHFQIITGTHLAHVPYRGAAPALQDLVAGQIDMMIDAPAAILPQARAGTVKAFAVTANNRLAAAPDVLTVDEAGVPGFYFSNWSALFAPKGTPENVIAKLNSAVVDALGDPAVRQRLADVGFDIPPDEQQTPEALAAFQKSEIEKW